MADALDVWAHDWPRRVTAHQEWAESSLDALYYLVESDAAPFVSVYSFPDGHTSDGNIPRINTLFIDFDIPDGEYVSGSGGEEAWRRDLSQLLVRVRKVARFLLSNGKAGWRASLSGHKGVHLFLDFPALSRELGSLAEYKAGVDEYATKLVEYIAAETGIRSLHEYVDVTSSDMGRLCRVPNTKHEGATESFGSPRFCVNVSIEELASITVDDYIELTSAPREMAVASRSENEQVSEILTQHVKEATPSQRRSRTSRSSFDSSRIERYREQSNDNITVDDIEFVTADRPCVAEYLSRDDKWEYGDQSHQMELFVIQELVGRNVPIDVIKEAFSDTPGYDKDETMERIRQVISRDYNRWSLDKIKRRAPEFT